MEIDTVAAHEPSNVPAAHESAACLELIRESMEQSDKERSKTPIVPEDKIILPNEVNGELPAAVETPSVSQVIEPSIIIPDSNELEISVLESPVQSKTMPVKKMSPEKSPEKIVESQPLLELSNVQVPQREDDVETNKASVPNREDASTSENSSSSSEVKKVDKAVRKLKEKALSLDSEMGCCEAEARPRTTERRRSKIFETAEKFNQLATNSDNDKPKKIFIPGVNVGGAKRAFERKASLSSITTPQPPIKPSAAKMIIDVPVEIPVALPKKSATTSKLSKMDEKKRAVDIITGALGKPPMQRKINGSPPTTPQSTDPKRIGLKLQIGPNEIRNASATVTTPVEVKFPFEAQQTSPQKVVS